MLYVLYPASETHQFLLRWVAIPSYLRISTPKILRMGPLITKTKELYKISFIVIFIFIFYL